MRTKAERGKISARKHSRRHDLKDNSIFKENKSARVPRGKKKVAGWPEYRRAKKIAPVHADAPSRLGLASKVTQKFCHPHLQKNNKKNCQIKMIAK